MKNLLLTAALAFAFITPVLAEDTAHGADHGAAHATEAAAPAAAPAVATETTPAADDANTTACKDEVGQKTPLADNASAEEHAQFDAAVAECVAAKAAPAATDAEAAADTAAAPATPAAE